jgi:DNA polymerase
MFVCDPPTPQAIKEGRYPPGEEGDLLSKIIQAGFLLKEEELYITPIVKCEAPKTDSLPEATIKVCSKITLKEIELVNPALVIAMGPLASQSLFGTTEPMDILRRKEETLTCAGKKIPLAMVFSLRDMILEKDNKKRFYNHMQKIKERLKKALDKA